MSGAVSVIAAYGVGSPLLWWTVTAVGVLLLIVSVFLLREPAGAGAVHEGPDGSAGDDAPAGTGRDDATDATARGEEHPAPSSAGVEEHPAPPSPS